MTGTLSPREEAERRTAPERLRGLLRDTHGTLDSLARLAARTIGASRGAIVLSEREHEWLELLFDDGLPPEPPRAKPGCALLTVKTEVIVEDVSRDAELPGRETLLEAGVRFYAGLPLSQRDGQLLGTLCVGHDGPLSPTPDQLNGLREIAAIARQHLETRMLALWLGAGHRALEVERDRLLAARAKRRTLTSMLVHDLRNPLTVMSMTARFAKENAKEPAVEAALDELLASAQVADGMVADILDVAQAEAAEIKVQPRTFDLTAMVSRLLSRLQFLAQYRGQSLQLIDRLSARELEADEVLLERVLRNLLENGFKYGPANRPIRVVLAAQDGEVELRVEDEGLPIPHALRQQIFDEYVRLDATKLDRPGHGLGLAFCRMAVDAHGGRIWVEQSDPVGGNAFCVRLPRTFRGSPRGASSA